VVKLLDPEAAAKEFRSLPRSVQLEAFELLLDAVVADGKIVKQEREYVALVGKEIGVGPEAIEDRLSERMDKRINPRR
jgi:hypothetical protein